MNNHRQIFFEFHALPTINRVTAIDSESGADINMPYPKGANIEDVKRLARQRLMFKIEKNSSGKP